MNYSTSVALCTFNGEKFIKTQLESIVNQSRKVNQIVICDDGSSDSTISIIERFIDEHTSCEISLYKNAKPLGVCGNFQKAISLCDGDIIFLSDQDDVWYNEKVSIILSEFDSHPDISVYFTNAHLIDHNGVIINPSKCLFDIVGLDTEVLNLFDAGCAFEIFLHCNRATGATMAFRKQFIPCFKIDVHAKPLGDAPLHDSSIAMAAITQNSLGYIKECLMSYRFHESQNCGLGSEENSPFVKDIFKYRQYEVQADIWKQYLPKEYIQRIYFHTKRLYLSKNSLIRFRQIYSMLQEYKKYFPNQWMKFVFYDMSHRVS